jgi:hypothetical protein
MMDGEVHITGPELINRGHDQPNVLIGYALPGRRARQDIIDIHFPTFSALKFRGDLARFARSESYMNGDNLVGSASLMRARPPCHSPQACDYTPTATLNFKIISMRVSDLVEISVILSY